MYMNVYRYIYIYIFTYVYICVYIYRYIYMYVFIYTCIHIYDICIYRDVNNVCPYVTFACHNVRNMIWFRVFDPLQPHKSCKKIDFHNLLIKLFVVVCFIFYFAQNVPEATWMSLLGGWVGFGGFAYISIVYNMACIYTYMYDIYLAA